MEFNSTMNTVYSGNITAIGHQFDTDRNCGVMRVEFKRGDVYDYFPVTKEKYQEIFSQQSKGKWFIENIKNAAGIQFEKV